jgi:hypothetical protein
MKKTKNEFKDYLHDFLLTAMDLYRSTLGLSEYANAMSPSRPASSQSSPRLYPAGQVFAGNTGS